MEKRQCEIQERQQVSQMWCFSHFAKDCRAPKHLVALYQKSLKESKQAGDKRYETHFNLSSETTPKESCSEQAPKQGNNKSLNMEDNLPSTDNMLIDFGSGDIFGDLE